MLQKGFNTDLSLGGISYHIQTEDWGQEKAYIVTKVFRSGAVIKSVKQEYKNFINEGPISIREKIGIAMRQQHQEILDLLHSGHFI